MTYHDATHDDIATALQAGVIVLDLVAEHLDGPDLDWLDAWQDEISHTAADYYTSVYFERPEDLDPDPDRTLETEFHYASYCTAADLMKTAENAHRLARCLLCDDENPEWVEQVLEADRRHEPERKRMRAEREKRDAERMAAHIAKYPYDDGPDSIGHQSDIGENVSDRT